MVIYIAAFHADYSHMVMDVVSIYVDCYFHAAISIICLPGEVCTGVTVR